MPRDVDPAVASLAGVELLDMETVAALTEANLAARHAETDAVRSIVDEELLRFAAEINAREVAPVVTSLREQAEGVRRAEFERFANRLEGLDDEQARSGRGPDPRHARQVVARTDDPAQGLAGSSHGDRLADRSVTCST